MTESELVIRLKNYLSKYFNVHQEVWSECGKKRIDMIVVCKESGAIFGIECKKIDYKRGEDLGLLINQATGYAKCRFMVNGKYEKIPVFITPPISHDILICKDKSIVHDGIEYFSDRHDLTHEHHTVNGMLGVLGCGEFRKRLHSFQDYYIFVFSNKTIWSSKPKFKAVGVDGLHKNNYLELLNKIAKW